MVFAAGTNSSLTDQLWDNPDELVESGSKMVEKHCVRTTVRTSVDDENIVVKRHLERSWRHFVKQCFNKSRSQRCWDDTWYLIDNGYPTPRPIAYAEKRLGPLRGNSWYVYEFIEGQTFKEAATDNKNQRLLRSYVSGLVEIWKLNRKLRINLTDGHPANFIVDATGKIWVIDLDKLQRLPERSNIDSILRQSFESTVRGVIGDRFVIEYGLSKFDRCFQLASERAA